MTHSTPGILDANPEARAIESDPERIEKTVRVFRRITDNPLLETDDGFVETMNALQRTAPRITIDKAFMND